MVGRLHNYERRNKQRTHKDCYQAKSTDAGLLDGY